MSTPAPPVTPSIQPALSPVVELQIANAKLTEENAKLKAQHVDHQTWRVGILRELENLRTKYGTTSQFP